MKDTMTITAQQLINVASGQVGYVEQGGSDGHSGNLTEFGKEYGLDGYAWCSIFVWWCFEHCGVDVRHTVSANYAGAENALEGFKAKGWLQVTRDPLPGDVAFFHFAGEHAGANHTGIVVDHDAGGVHTIEGNTSSGTSGSQVNGGGVYRRYRPYSVIIGYGRYPFAVAATNHQAPPAPSAGKTYPTFQRGSTGEGVRRLETLLHLPVDPPSHGMFGPQCVNAVHNYQQAHHLQVDGVAGPATLRALGW